MKCTVSFPCINIHMYTWRTCRTFLFLCTGIHHPPSCIGQLTHRIGFSFSRPYAVYLCPSTTRGRTSRQPRPHQVGTQRTHEVGPEGFHREAEQLVRRLTPDAHLRERGPPGVAELGRGAHRVHPHRHTARRRAGAHGGCDSLRAEQGGKQRASVVIQRPCRARIPAKVKQDPPPPPPPLPSRRPLGDSRVVWSESTAPIEHHRPAADPFSSLLLHVGHPCWALIPDPSLGYACWATLGWGGSHR
mmetsp:Transcript_22956/g.52047  ORF Transcript_22956/g.52047 Transcript_22956/m.52047 type:complete len:245 (+) Transcript_22956:346-1080(+)